MLLYVVLFIPAVLLALLVVASIVDLVKNR